ncbi:hypothetical protein BOC60_20305 [Burkholderia pseudomallei]|nr:hypothetical protein BOC60_20305 [Burkholderia pseudomallei]
MNTKFGCSIAHRFKQSSFYNPILAASAVLLVFGPNNPADIAGHIVLVVFLAVQLMIVAWPQTDFSKESIE